MKNHPLVALLAASLFISIAVAPNLPAQLPGGFADVPLSDDMALTAAKFAVAAHDPALTFQSIEKVGRQVVAGLNYRITLKVLDNAKARRADVIVWRKLDGKHELTSWKWLDAAR